MNNFYSSKLIFFGLNIFYGAILSVGLYQLILVDLDLENDAALGITVIIWFLIVSGNLISYQIRCISFLIMPSFCGRAGRSVIKALALAYIISGPIENLTKNGHEVVRVFACTTSLTYNLTKARYVLMFKPFKDALFGMKNDANEVKDALRSIQDVSAPIFTEVEDESELRQQREENDYIDQVQGDSQRSDDLERKYMIQNETEAEIYQKKYLKKVESRCEDQLSRGTSKCRQFFSSAHENCKNKVTWVAAWLLCWPMKLTFVCNIGEAIGGSKVCDPAKKLDPGFGKGYMYLKHSKDSLRTSLSDVKLQYKIERIPQLTNVRDAADTAKGVIHAFNKKKTFLNSIFLILKRFLALIFLKAIFTSQNYHDSYLREITFDNIYVTRYFRKIDARRHKREQYSLLPLKKVERTKLVVITNVRPLKFEREHLVSETFKLLLEMITATTFVLLDRLFFEALDLVRRHAHINYEQTGHHDMTLEVRGTGMIASILRSIVKGFNFKKRIKTVHTNAACLPKPTKVSSYYLYKIYGSYFVVWLLILIQTYTQRTRHVICAYFYPKREKQRVLHLYNQTLKRRRGFFKLMRTKINKQIRERRLEENLNIFMLLHLHYSRVFFWLRCFSCARRKCIICGEIEPRTLSKSRRFVECNNHGCVVIYCLECWFDIYKKCLACIALESDDDDNSTSESNQSDYE